MKNENLEAEHEFHSMIDIRIAEATGDRVLFSSYAGTDVKVDGEEFLVMGEEDILAILK